jgi:DNA topoisomerase II
LPKLQPYARGFNGVIEDNPDGGGYITWGRISKVSNTSLLIDELPLRSWTIKYKEYLLRMRDKETISDFVENHTTTKVSFTVSLNRTQMEKLQKTGLAKAFKLKSTLSTSNMNAFDSTGTMTLYSSAEDIVDAFFETRMTLYEHRKSVLQSEANYHAAVFRNKAKFIEAVTSNEIDLLSGRRTKLETEARLEVLGFTKTSELQVVRNSNTLHEKRQRQGISNYVAGEDGNSDADEQSSSEYDYLLSMPISCLTAEKDSNLRNEASKKDAELERIRATTPSDLWKQDLDRLAAVL